MNVDPQAQRQSEPSRTGILNGSRARSKKGNPSRDLGRFHDRLHQAVAQAERTGEQIAVHRIEVREASADRLGRIAVELASITRESDSLLRIEPGVFFLLQRSISDLFGASTLARKLLRLVQGPPKGASSSLRTPRAVVGLCLHASGFGGQDLLERAREAASAAWTDGGSTFRCHKGEATSSLRPRVVLEEDLQRALDEGRFFLEYQPQIDLRRGEVLAFEALVRWQDSVAGRLGPKQFIATAEANGLIVELGMWILEEACRRCRKWNRDRSRPIPVAVNLSARQLQDSSFLDRVLDTLDRTELDPSLLELELTETACFESGEAGRAVFSALRERGVGLALDDFGTGYGSLQVLHSFPIRKIKIPGLFVHAAEDRELDAAILHAAADLGQSVGITVVAEGVETPKQLAMVLATRCHAAQGFLLGRPSIVPQLRSKAAFSSLAGRHPLQQGSAAPPSSYSAGR